MKDRELSWDALGAAWRESDGRGAADVAALRARLRRARVLGAFVVCAEFLIAAGALAWAVRLMRTGVPRDVVTGVVIAVFTAIVGMLAVSARRGTFEDAGDTVVATLAAAVRGAEVRARAYVATYAASATALAFLGALWLLQDRQEFGGLAERIAIAVCALALVVAVTAWRDRRNRAELERLRVLLASLTAPPGA
jgi:hypothetical protein